MQMAEYFGQKMGFKRWTNEFGGVYVFILTLLDVVVKTHMSMHDSNHAFIQANSNDVRFMGVHDGLQVFMHKDVAASGVRISNIHDDLDQDDAFSTSTYLKFVPPQLDFNERHLGVPHLEKVMLVNTDTNKTIHMLSISGNTLHFHSSFFQDKTIPPKGNTSFAVVFLGRAEGQVSSNLYIHTSEGTFKYHVSGASVGSPYRLRPLGGVRLPLNAAFQPLIHIHNPHHYPIQVVEVYSSGSEFHLELPGGELEGPKTLWEVPPFMTKPVIRARFDANVHSNHTAYIRMKLNNSEEVLVVPLEVEVTSQPGLYSPQHVIDFGLGGSLDPPTTVKLLVCNSLKKVLRIQSVAASPPNSALKVDFEAVKIPPGTTPVEIAQLTFDWKAGFDSRHTSGSLWIKTKQGQFKLTISYTATVLEGGLRVNETVTRFLIGQGQGLTSRNVTVVNSFKVPVAVNNVTLLEEAARHFQVKQFKPTIIPAGKKSTLFLLGLRENAVRDVHLETGLILHTNVSDVRVPLLSFNGKLTTVFPAGYEDSDLLDLGLVSSGAIKVVRFGLHNNNPVPVTLRAVSSNSASVVPQLMGVHRGNLSSLLSSLSPLNMTNSTLVHAHATALVLLTVHASKAEQLMSSQLVIVSQHDRLVIPVRVSSAHGSLELAPRDIVFADCFPGKTCAQPLKVQSSFNRPMTATGVTSVPPDPRLSFSVGPGASEILPGASSYIGELRWEPGKQCGHNCYLGMPHNSSNGLHYTQSEALPSYISDTDATLLKDRYQRLLNLTQGVGSGYWHDLVLRLDTNEVREQIFKAKVGLVWPKVCNTSKLVFPLTQVTNTTIQRLKLYNPASHTMAVQLVMGWLYPQAKRLLDSLSPAPSCGSDCLNFASKEFFISQNFPDSSEPDGKLSTTLAPGESYEVSLAYTPDSPQRSVGLLFIRNNLTVIEVVELTGQAAYAQMKFGNRKPGSDNPLTFDIAEKHLRDCHRERNKKFPSPNLTVKRSFTARNVGDLPIFVHNFYISGLECEGYGFSVLNCGPFELPANGTKKIDVAFTPDFTLAKIQRTLTIETSLGVEVNYTLITTLPPYVLSTCASVLGRPTWEPLLYYSAVSFMVFLLFCVLAAAFFESDRILKCALTSMSRDRATVPLDFRDIGKEFSGKKSECGDLTEQNKAKDLLGVGHVMNGDRFSGWVQGLSADDRQFEKEEPSTPSRLQESPVKVELCPAVQMNNLNKTKKKVSKKNSNNSEPAAAAVAELQNDAPSKKKLKNVGNTGWCNVFARGTAAVAPDKVKLKLNANDTDNIKHIRNDIDVRKPDKREEKRANKIKKNINKEPHKEEEETSSTTTDSSNDAEKENIKGRNSSGNKTKLILVDCKDNYEGDCDDDDFEKEKVKPYQGRTVWKVNAAAKAAAAKTEPLNVNIWKPAVDVEHKMTPVLQPGMGGDLQKQRVPKNNTRDRKEKNMNKRRFGGEKILNQKVSTSEPSAVHHNPPQPVNCWEHRSFSEVVARNDSPLLYSNIVSSKKQPVQPPAPYSESNKPCDTSSSILGPIGSKKPSSNNWSPIPYASLSSGVSNAVFSVGNLLDQSVGGAGLEDSLPLDPDDMWEDQNAVMQLMHQQDNSFNSMSSWKEQDNWADYLWSRNPVAATSSMAPPMNPDYQEAAWGSLLRPSWDQSPWTSANNSQASAIGQRSPFETSNDTVGLASNYGTDYSVLLSQNAGLIGSLGQQASPGHYSQQPQHQARAQQEENNAPVSAGLQFDPFHSLGSIWSPKAPNTWGNQ